MVGYKWFYFADNEKNGFSVTGPVMENITTTVNIDIQPFMPLCVCDSLVLID